MLDLARWSAAGLVVINHLRGIVFTDYRLMHADGILFRILFFVSGFGHHAVIIFFALSGYLVGGEVLRSFQRNDFLARGYAVKRIARIYAVYFAALALGGLFDWIGLHHLNGAGLYTHDIDFWALEYSAADRLNLHTLIANILFCQRLIAEPFGSNEPLWSLANEAWYYLMFPLLAYAVFGARARARVACVALLTAASWFVQGPMLDYFVVWLIGLAPCLLTRPLIKKSWIPAILLVGTFVMARFVWFGLLSMLEQDLILAVTFVLLVNSYDYTGSFGASRFLGLNHKLAGFSYSVYLLHWPLAMLLVAASERALGFGLRMTEFNWRTATFLAALVFAVYLYAWAVSLFTERKTPAVRRWLSSLLAAPAEPS
jgi:peptidoglycan/LPS O-acetylase OafA/YrhL